VTLGDLLEALAASGVTLAVREGELLYHGPRLTTDDPVRTALATFHDEVVWLLLAGRLCVNCPRELAQGDRICCPIHRRLVDATPLARAAPRSGSDAHGVPPTVDGRRAPELDRVGPRGRSDGHSADPAADSDDSPC